MDMNNLPVEIIIAIGRFMRGPTLVASLQVNKRWYKILYPLLWRRITRRLWHHSGFPLREERLVTSIVAVEATKNAEAQIEVEETPVVQTALDDPQLTRLLSNVLSLEWRDVSIIKGVPRREARRKSPLTLKTIERIIGLASNLVVLSLSFIYLVKTDTLSTMVAALHGLTRLKDLTLFMKVDVVTPVNIEDLFPVFSRLDRLSVGGPWITNEREQNQLSIESRASAVGELNESSLSWEVKELNVNGRLLSLARHCPILKSLSTTTESILKSWGTVPYTPRHLSRCLQLEELKLSCLSAAREFLDTATLLPALRKLKVLSLQVITPEGLDFLNSSTGLPVDLSDTNNASNDAQRIVDDRALDRILVMPMLETLSVICSHCAPGDHNRMQVALGKFFMSRTRLKSIYLGNVYINPLHIFAQPGMELERGWACTTLETITLKLPGPFKYTGMTLEEQRAEMSSTYRQFGCLSQLQMLSIECDSLFSFHDPAILQLKGATKLRKLSLTLVKGWTYEGVAVLLEAVPGLRVLSLSLVLPGDHVLVKGWLKELGRPDVALLQY